MKQLYSIRFFILLLLFATTGCKEKMYVIDEDSTMRYDVLALPAPAAATDLLTVAFLSASVGFVGGVGGTVYATADGGQTWTSRSQPSLGDVRKLRLSSGPTVWAATSVGLFKTVNGGQNWQRAQIINSSGTVGPAFDVQFASGSWLWSASIDNIIGSSADTFAYGNPLRFALTRQRTPQRPRTVSLSLQRRF